LDWSQYTRRLYIRLEPKHQRTVYGTGINTPEGYTLDWDQHTRRLYIGLEPSHHRTVYRTGTSTPEDCTNIRLEPTHQRTYIGLEPTHNRTVNWPAAKANRICQKFLLQLPVVPTVPSVSDDSLPHLEQLNSQITIVSCYNTI